MSEEKRQEVMSEEKKKGRCDGEEGNTVTGLGAVYAFFKWGNKQ